MLSLAWLDRLASIASIQFRLIFITHNAINSIHAIAVGTEGVRIASPRPELCPMLRDIESQLK